MIQGNKEQVERLAPPYISLSTLITFLDWLKSMPVMPNKIDRSLWQGKFGGSVGAQLMTALRFLRLLEKDAPTPRLQSLVQAEADQRKELLKALLQEVYGTDLVQNLPAMTPKTVDDALSNLGSTPATHRKALTFFLQTAKFTGLQIPAVMTKRVRVRTSGNVIRRSKLQSNGGEKEGEAIPVDQVKGGAGSTSESTFTVSFGGAGDLALRLKVDLFRLSPTDTEFVLKLKNLVLEHQDKQLTPGNGVH